jgi:hypothetical protein
MKANEIERIAAATVKAYFESEAYREAQMQMITEIISEMNEG